MLFETELLDFSVKCALRDVEFRRCGLAFPFVTLQGKAYCLALGFLESASFPPFYGVERYIHWLCILYLMRRLLS